MGRLPSAAVGLAGAAAILFVQLVGGAHLTQLTIAAGFAAALIAFAAQNPAAGLGVIIALVPFQLILLAWLNRYGVPAVILKDAGYIKDAMVVGIVIAALQARFYAGRPRQRLRFLDYAAGIYVVIASAYLLFPIAFPGTLGGQLWSVRLNAWRVDCLYVVLLLACRHLAFSDKAKRALFAVVAVAIVGMFGSALWETFAQTSYRNFLVQTINLPGYYLGVLHAQPPAFYIYHGVLGGHEYVRDGGFFADPLALGFFTVLPFGLGAQWLLSTEFRFAKLLPAAAAGTTAMLAVTRSAILGCAVALIVLIVIAVVREARGRVPTLLVLAAGILIALPLIGGTPAVARFEAIFNSSATSNVGENNDTSGHAANSRAAYTDVIEHPAGRGLGANFTTGSRFGTTNSIDTENSYLQVGTELGIAGMLAFLAMYLSLLTELVRTSRRPGITGDFATGAFAAGVGLLVAGFFLPIWTSFAVSLLFWGISGAALESERR